MTRPAHTDTLFHLEPADHFTSGVLSHHNNGRLVSLSPQGEPALEIGYHVHQIARGGQVLARLGRGRSADLVLDDQKISETHIAFEVHPVSHAILLCISARNSSSVTIQPNKVLRTDDGFRQFVLIPGQEYTISIQALAGILKFHLRWRLDLSSIARAVDAGFQAAETRVVITQFAKTHVDEDNDIGSWYNTRLSSSRLENGVRNVQLRKVLGVGAFGNVHEGLDLDSGHLVAVKIVEPDNEQQFKSLHREIQTLGTLKHPYIIEFLGHTGWPAEWNPEVQIQFFMPLKEGSLRDLIPLSETNTKSILIQLLREMLSALDYLSFQGLCHRDVKPLNILFNRNNDASYTFFLSDFGFVNHEKLAHTFCGTRAFLAPELHADLRLRKYPQTSKLDVWSLLVTVLSIMPKAKFNEGMLARGPESELRAYVKDTTIKLIPNLEPMAREDPSLRASAAQILVQVFEGNGLTTPRAKVGAIPKLPTPAATTATRFQRAASSGPSSPPEPAQLAPVPPPYEPPAFPANLRKPPTMATARRVRPIKAEPPIKAVPERKRSGSTTPSPPRRETKPLLKASAAIEIGTAMKRVMPRKTRAPSDQRTITTKNRVTKDTAPPPKARKPTVRLKMPGQFDSNLEF